MKNRINIIFSRFSIGNMFIKNTILQCIGATLAAEQIPVSCEINVLISDDEGLREINKHSRNIDKATDVLSFPMFQLTAGEFPADYSEMIDPESGLCPLGDMAISLERAVAQAKEFGHSTRREVGYLTIHSVLHLLGYDHLDEGPQKAQMREREEQIASDIPGMQR